ncbi:MAG: hypothetical protein J5599_01560 [Spirochaetales bacterium]|nr:hypothetical protein [Spirochaetales bacterium]
MSSFLCRFTPSLFWDVDISEIDDEKYRRFIIQRVLERGDLSDWKSLKSRYSLKVIVKEAQNIRCLDAKALAFISCVGNVPKESFRCFSTQ